MPAKRKKWMMAPAEFLLRATQGHSHLVPPTELTWTGPWDHNAGCLDVLILVGLQLTLHHHLDNILLRVLMAWLLLSNKPRFKS